MAHLIDKSALVAEIERRIKINKEFSTEYVDGKIFALKRILSFIDTLEVTEVGLKLITGWFDHIAQIADDRMTANGQRMTDAHALDEIKCLAKNSSEFIAMHYRVQKGE